MNALRSDYFLYKEDRIHPHLPIINHYNFVEIMSTPFILVRDIVCYRFYRDCNTMFTFSPYSPYFSQIVNDVSVM